MSPTGVRAKDECEVEIGCSLLQMEQHQDAVEKRPIGIKLDMERCAQGRKW